MRRASIAVAALLALACTRESDVDLAIDVGPVPGAASVRIELHEGAVCEALLDPGSGRPAPLFSTEATVGSALPRFPGVSEGIYAVLVEARDGSGCVLGAGCGESRLPTEGVRVRVVGRDNRCAPTGTDAGPPPGCDHSGECSSGEVCCGGDCVSPDACRCSPDGSCEGELVCCDGRCHRPGPDFPCGDVPCEVGGSFCPVPGTICCEAECFETVDGRCPGETCPGCPSGSCCGGGCCDGGEACCGTRCAELGGAIEDCGACGAACGGQVPSCSGSVCGFRFELGDGVVPRSPSGSPLSAALVFYPPGATASTPDPVPVGAIRRDAVLSGLVPPDRVMVCERGCPTPSECPCLDSENAWAMGGIALLDAGDLTELPDAPLADLPIAGWADAVVIWRATPGTIPPLGTTPVAAGHTVWSPEGDVIPYRDALRFGDPCDPSSDGCAPSPPSLR